MKRNSGTESAIFSTTIFTGSRYLCILALPFLLLFFLSTQALGSHTVTFTWQTNPEDENVAGYRLYYGLESRFNAAGGLKTDFSYDYYIDLSDATRCNSTGTSCESLGPDQLLCDNLYSGQPRCSLFGLEHTSYFSLTAYTSVAESNFTQELKYSIFIPSDGGGGPASPAALAAVSSIVKNLLLAKH